MTFTDRQLNSMTFRVFHDLYEPCKSTKNEINRHKLASLFTYFHYKVQDKLGIISTRHSLHKFMGQNIVLLHLKPNMIDITTLDLSREIDGCFRDARAQADLFKSSSAAYLPCCDLLNTLHFTVPSLPFLSMDGLFTHFSFIDLPSERQMCILPLSR